MKRQFAILVLVILGVVALVGISRNAEDRFLWFDEAGQFWIAKGLNHDSDPLQPPGTLSAVVENNASYNFDPGGYSVVLHFWTSFSDSVLWMRTLSFAFFIAADLLFIYSLYRITGELAVGIAMGFLPLFSPTLIESAFEIRAYSMEYLGIAVGLVGLYAVRSEASYERLFMVSLAYSAFMTSRYSAIAILATASLYTLLHIWLLELDFWDRFWRVALYGAPLIATASLIYVFELRSQDSSLEPLFYLPYLRDDPQLLINPIGNLGYLVLVSLLGCLLLSMVLGRGSSFLQVQPLLFVAVASNLLFIVLSLRGLYPWAPLSRYGLPYLTVSTVAGSAAIGRVVVQLYRRLPSVVNLGLIALVVFSLYINWGDRHVRDGTMQTFRCLASVDFGRYRRIYVDRWASPSIRYLFEFGSLLQAWPGIYPGRFEFAKALPHSSLVFGTENARFFAAQPRMNDLLDYDLLITPELYNSGGSDEWTALKGCERWVFVRTTGP